jgi:hypothetical protein
VSLCPELDVASQGKTIEEARDNLREALELFRESASPAEIKQSGNLGSTGNLAGNLGSEKYFLNVK